MNIVCIGQDGARHTPELIATMTENGDIKGHGESWLDSEGRGKFGSCWKLICPKCPGQIWISEHSAELVAVFIAKNPGLSGETMFASVLHGILMRMDKLRRQAWREEHAEGQQREGGSGQQF